MKIVVTISDGTLFYHLGTNVEHESAIMEIPDENVPKILKEFLERRDKAAKDNVGMYESVQFSLLREE